MATGFTLRVWNVNVFPVCSWRNKGISLRWSTLRSVLATGTQFLPCVRKFDVLHEAQERLLSVHTMQKGCCLLRGATAPWCPKTIDLDLRENRYIVPTFYQQTTLGGEACQIHFWVALRRSLIALVWYLRRAFQAHCGSFFQAPLQNLTLRCWLEGPGLHFPRTAQESLLSFVLVRTQGSRIRQSRSEKTESALCYV